MTFRIYNPANRWFIGGEYETEAEAQLEADKWARQHGYSIPTTGHVSPVVVVPDTFKPRED